MTLLEIIRMLRDKDGWRFVYPLPDYEATYKDTGIYSFLDTNGVAFRKYNPPPIIHGGPMVYQPNILAFMITHIFTGILRRYMVRKEMSK